MNLSQIFATAHATARNFRNKAITYRKRFAAGLKMAYAAAKQALTTKKFEVSTSKADSPASASQYKQLEHLGATLLVSISQFVKCCEYSEAADMLETVQAGFAIEVA